MTAGLLRLLKESNGPVSGQEIAGKLGVSRTAVWKHIKELRALGFQIDAAPGAGYRLTRRADILLPAELEALVPAAFSGNVVHYPSIGSTNDAAKEMAGAGLLKPAGLVLADEQTGGRGRFGRRWFSPKGGIWASVVIRPKIAAMSAGRAALMAAVAAAEAVIEVAGVKVKIKWPNDLLVEGKKVAGILIEMAAELGRVDYLVIGIGINANFPATWLDAARDPANKRFEPFLATTLMTEAGRPVDRAVLLAATVTKIYNDQLLLEDGFESVTAKWRSLSETLGRMVRAEVAGKLIEGRAVDVDSDGALMLEEPSGRRLIVRSGEVM